MTDTPPRVELVANGQTFSGWKGVSLSATLDDACRRFNLGALDVNLPTTEPPGNPLLIRPGTECAIYTRGIQVLSGYVDAVTISARGDATTVNFRGRSRTEDLVDCTALPTRRRWTERSVLTIARDIASPYQVQVRWGLDGQAPKVSRFKLQRAEKCFSAIDRLVKPLGLLLVDNAQGELVITQAGAVKAGTALVGGENILESTGTYDAEGLFSSYICRGQIALATDDPADLLAHIQAETTEELAVRDRTLEIIPSSRASSKRCQTLAEFEASVRQGKSVDLRATVTGWTQGDGTLWEPGQLVHVTDTIQAVVAELLIVGVDYTLDETMGELAALRLAPLEGYLLLPEPERKKRRRRGLSPHAGIGVWDIPKVGPLALGIGTALANIVAADGLRRLTPKKLKEALKKGQKKVPPKRPDAKVWWGLTGDKGGGK